MDLNHARLPIPPRWQVDFHRSGDPSSPCQEDLHLYSTDAKPPVKPDLVSFVSLVVDAFSLRPEAEPYSNFAVIVIFAFSTFDTGHPFSAASAYF